MPHEPLDRRHAVPVGIAQPDGQFPLHVEGQPFIGPPDQIVEIDANAPQKGLGPLKLPEFRPGQQALVDQLGDIFDLIGKFADPEQCVKVTKTALSLLQIGFDDITAVPHPLVTGFAFGELVSDKGLGCAAYHLFPEPHPGLGIKRLISPDIARFEQGRPDGQVGLGHVDHLVQRPARLADFQAKVPQHVQHRFNDLLGPGRLLPRGQERDVDIGEGRHLPAPISADGHQRQPFCSGRIGHRIEDACGKIVDQPQQLIGQQRMAHGILHASIGGLSQASFQFGAASLQRIAEDDHRSCPAFCPVRLAARHLAQGIGQRPTVNDRTSVGDLVKALGHRDILRPPARAVTPADWRSCSRQL